MWVPPEDVDPIVFQAPTRKGISVFGTVQLSTGKLISEITPKFDAVTFQAFLEYLVDTQYCGVQLYVILDNSRYHHAKVLAPWLDEHKDEIILEFLPPYSPKLNPIERVWKLLRSLCTHNRYFQTLEELTDTVRGQFKSWDKPNDTLRKLCAVN